MYISLVLLPYIMQAYYKLQSDTILYCCFLLVWFLKFITLVRSLLDLKHSQGPKHSNVLIRQKVILVKSKPITAHVAICAMGRDSAVGITTR